MFEIKICFYIFRSDDVKIRNLFVVGVVGLSVLLLGGCGKTPKEQFLSATNDVLEAKQLETKNTVSVDLDTSLKGMLEEYKIVLGVLKQTKMQYDSKKDVTNGKEEAKVNITTKTESMSREINLPILLDLQQGKSYIKSDSITSLFSFMGIPNEAFSSFKGKILEWDIQEDILKWEDGKKLNQQFKSLVEKELQSLPEKNYKKEKNTVQITLQEKELVKLASQSIDILYQYPFFEFTKEDVKDFKEELSKGILKDSSLTAVYTFQGNHLKKQTFKLNVNIPIEEEGFGGIKGTIKLEREIVSTNKPFASTFDYTSKENIIPFSEVEKIMDKYYEDNMADDEDFDIEEEDTVDTAS